MQAGGKAGKAGYSYAQIKSAVEDITKRHVAARKAAGRTTTYSGLRSAGREIFQQWEKVSITSCLAATYGCSCAVLSLADQLEGRCIWHLSQLAHNLTGEVLQMTDENLDLNIGFRFVRVPGSDSVRRSQVRWRLAMKWDDLPVAQGPQVVSHPSLGPHLTAAVPQHQSTDLIPLRLRDLDGLWLVCAIL